MVLIACSSLCSCWRCFIASGHPLVTVLGRPGQAFNPLGSITLLVLFMAGRFIGTALLRFLAPARLLGVFALLNLLLCAVAVALPGWIGLYALVASSLFMSVMFPTIFALGLDGLDDDARKLGASLIVMAIIGGAALTAVMGADPGARNRLRCAPPASASWTSTLRLVC
ncbi:hypothetical protein NB693_24585 [Pantoea ananatis]|uniref:hypothetical protein n=1 Tax=Pantoea ananas TaxID=553 RepID=UPI00221E4D87|nr:hypothetical protein [Pantoea ananatis]